MSIYSFPTIFVVAQSVKEAQDWARRNVLGGSRMPICVGFTNLDAMRGSRNSLILRLPSANHLEAPQFLFDPKRNVIVNIAE